jgi:Tfp pilus assembly protein FimT
VINRRQSGFTILELLLVVGIIILTLSFAIPAITSLASGNNLNTAGRVVSNTLTIARSEAINRRALIRFEVATSWPADASAAYQKFTLVQHDLVTATDTQLTKWETLPAGIVFQPQDPTPGLGSYFFTLNQTQNPPLKSGTQDISTTYVEFGPTGALNIPPSNSPMRLRIVPGIVSGATSVTPTNVNNWFEMRVDSLVGRIQVFRP